MWKALHIKSNNLLEKITREKKFISNSELLAMRLNLIFILP